MTKTIQDSTTVRVDGAEGWVTLTRIESASGPMLEARVQGELTPVEFKDVLARLKTPPFGPQIRTLWDFRGHSFAGCTAQKCQSLAFALSKLPERRGVKRAFVVDSSHGFGSIRMFQQTANGFDVEDEDKLHVSYDIDDALSWLAA